MNKLTKTFYISLFIFSCLIPVILEMRFSFYGMIMNYLIFLVLLRIWFPLFAIFFSIVIITCAVFLPQIIWFGNPPATMFASFFETDLAESKEFLRSLPFYSYIFSFLVFAFGIYILFTATKITTQKRRWLTATFALIALALTLCKALYVVTKQNEPFNIEKTRISIISFYSSVFSTLQEYRTEKAEFQKNINLPNTWSVVSSSPKYQDYVIVIGESVRRDYMSAYGFSENNTPFMQTVNGTLIDGYTAAAPNTASSLTRTLLQNKNNEFLYSNNIITLAKKAGFHTVWISNQGFVGQHDAPISRIATSSNQYFFTKKGNHSTNNYYDTILLPALEKQVNNHETLPKNRLFILHIYGSHPTFISRLESPVHFYYYNINISAYIQTIEQTDNFLNSVYNIFKRSNRSFSIMYFSDHGLTTRERNSRIYATLAHAGTPPHKNAYDVPFALISSDDTSHKVLKVEKSAFNFLHGFASWLGIKEKSLNPNYNFLSPVNDSLKVFDHYKNVDYHSLQADPVIK